MVFIDKVVSESLNDFVCLYKIKRETPFLHKNRVPSFIAIECMAQSISAFNGMRRRDSKLEPQLGFLLGIRDFTCHYTYFELGDQLELHIHSSFVNESMGNFRVKTLLNNESVASCNMTVIQVDGEQLKLLRREANV